MKRGLILDLRAFDRIHHRFRILNWRFSTWFKHPAGYLDGSAPVLGKE